MCGCYNRKTNEQCSLIHLVGKGKVNLRNTLKNYLRIVEKNKRYRIRGVSLLLVLSLIVSVNVFWGLRQTGLTLAGTAACGYEEHTHSDECFKANLICNMIESSHTHTDECYATQVTESQSDPVLVCDLTEVPHEHIESCYILQKTEGHDESTLICVNSDEAHVHTDECYSLVHIEGSEEKVLVCNLVTEPHIHTESCYAQHTETTDKYLICTIPTETHEHAAVCYEKVLVCEKKEHIHELTCYSDEMADVETQLDWQAMFAGMITGDLRKDLVSIAESQLGYTESILNFEVNEDGTRNGYTRYGAWYGAPYSDWSAMFVSFCLHYAGSGSADTPYNIGANTMLQLWNSAGRFASSDVYSPDDGDLIFFTDNTVGIISSVSFDVLTVIKGDVDNSVCEQTIMDYDESIIGYGILEMPHYSSSLFATNEATSSGFVPDACTCGNDTAEASSHADTCAYKAQLKTIAGDYTVDELYAIWNQLSSDAQEYILQYLTDNAWQYGTKAEDLKALINGGGSTGGNTTASCGDANFSVQGDIPETAELKVSDPEYSEAQKITYVNPNIQNHVNWSMVYDISIIDNGATYTPTSPVTVTVELPTLTSDEYNPETMLFYVVHLNEATGEELSKERVEVVDNTITFTATGFSPYLFYSINMDSEGGERILGTNWMKLRDSGFFTYWEQFLPNSPATTNFQIASMALSKDSNPSDVQIDAWGGESTNGDGVVVSKTIDGTDIENVFDITLTVQTQQSISEIYEEPDMAVVIVMDISNTMKNDFGDTTRYKAAMLAAENFIDNFAAHSGDVSRIGYVAFNTSGHEIFGLSSCATTTEATALKNEMRQETGTIINASGYADSHTRFTNVEAGLKMGYDMLATAQNEHKYLIFLSDGFPTTYISSGYAGYDPYTSSGTKGADGVFYDYVTGYYCSYGTSYSDKATIRARQQAEEIKNNGVTIFSIGVDVGGQTIAGHDGREGLSVIDRTGTTYEIGDASSTTSYVNWLQNSIGSKYYYDSTDADGLQAAYDDIFEEILRLKEEASEADWVAQDPIPLAPPEYLEFIGFYDRNMLLQSSGEKLTGLSAEGAENTAVFDLNPATNLHTISWDLKRSGYNKSISGDVTTYSYQLVYRVRLKNELEGFVENQVYDTNAPTSLRYRVFESENGVTTLSEQRVLMFQIPAVHGYLVELEFMKKDSYGNNLAGAEFSLTHDTASCPICRGDNMNSVAVPLYTAVSTADGRVSFTGIPSGHTYILQETKAPPGYISDTKQYKVVVAYDVLTIDGEWNGTVVNKTGSEFPSTGGTGILPYILTGLFLVIAPVVCEYIRRRKRERRSGV